MQAPPPPPSEALAAALAELRPGLEILSMPCCVIDPQQRYRYLNRAYLAFANRKEEQMLGKTVAEIAKAPPRDERRSMLARALAGEELHYDRVTTQGPDSGRWVRAHYIPVRRGGDVLGVTVVVVDIQPLKDAQAAIAARERQLTLITDTIGFPVTYVDKDFIVRFVNAQSAAWSGAKPEDMIGRLFSVLAPPKIAANARPLLERAFAGESVTYEREALWPGRENRRIRGHMIPDRDESGAVRGAIVVLIDIEDDYRQREALARQERQLRFFTDNIPVCVAYLDAQRRYRYVNRAFADMQGKAPEDIVGKTSAEILGENVAADLGPAVQGALKGEAITCEREVELPSGKRRWMLVRCVPDIDADGTIRGMYTVGNDIQDLKQAQAELRAREEELRHFADNIPEAIVYIDLVRGCTFVNNIFLASRGMTRDFALGRFPKDVYTPETVKLLQPYLERVGAGERVTYERLLQTPGKSEDRWIRVSLTPRVDDSGRVLGYYVVSSDIDELKRSKAASEEKELVMRQVMDSVPTPLVYVDLEQRYRYVNNAFLAFVGKSADEVLGHTVAEVLGESRFNAILPILRSVWEGKTVADERLLPFPGGRQRWMSLLYTPRHDAQGRLLGYYATSSDVHDQKMAEAEARRAHRILSAHIENTPLAVIERDPLLSVVRWSGSAEAIFGWRTDEVCGTPGKGWRFVYEDDSAVEKATLRRLKDGLDVRATILHRNYRKDGSVVWVEWHHSAMREASGALVSILSFAQDVSSRIQAEERLQHLATHDGLTGLPNRLLLHDRLTSAMARTQRFGHGVAVMFVDLDHFKDVNDTFGHRIGDELLKALTRRVGSSLRESDLLVRLSGDEFVVVIEHVESEGGPDRVAQKILSDVKHPFLIEGKEVQVNASLGYAVFPGDGDDAETLIKNADAAMYHAKEMGRNNFRAFSQALARRRDARLDMETSLRRAIRDREFELHYQPILDVDTGHVSQVEALLRWPQPGQGFVSPADFIPVAEEAGLMREIGQWVFVTAARQAVAWNRKGSCPLSIGVNLSAGELRDATIVDELAVILKWTRCSARWLTLEITETSMVRDVASAISVLGKLRRKGFRIAIDDFGTGFSSLSHLRQMPVNVLKIDKSFVADVCGSRGRTSRKGGGAIVAAVTGLARGLELEVVAEGVEHESQLDFLRGQGCKSYQGYLASRPLPADKLDEWLAKRAMAGARAKPAVKIPARESAAARTVARKKRAPGKPVAWRPRSTGR